MYKIRLYLNEGHRSSEEFIVVPRIGVPDNLFGYNVHLDSGHPYNGIDEPPFIEFSSPLVSAVLDPRLDSFVERVTLRGTFPLLPARENGIYRVRQSGIITEAGIDATEKNRLIYIIGCQITSVLDLYWQIRQGTIRPEVSYDKEQVKPEPKDEGITLTK